MFTAERSSITGRKISDSVSRQFRAAMTHLQPLNGKLLTQNQPFYNHILRFEKKKVQYDDFFDGIEQMECLLSSCLFQKK